MDGAEQGGGGFVKCVMVIQIPVINRTIEWYQKLEKSLKRERFREKSEKVGKTRKRQKLDCRKSPAGETARPVLYFETS